MSGSIGLMLGTISFPNLNLSFQVDRVAFTIGNFSIYWYAVLIFTGMLLSIIAAVATCKKYGILDNDLLDYIIAALPAGIIGARLYYCAFEWSSYRKDSLWETIKALASIRDGGLAIYGGLIGAFLAVFIVSRVKKQNLLHVMDFAVPFIALSQGLGRWGNFVNQEAFGVNTTLPWGMTGDHITSTLLSRQSTLLAQGITVDPALPVHPTFLYESVCDILIGILLLVMRRRLMDRKEGFNTLTYLALYGLCRGFIEGLRIDSLMWGPVRVSQVLAFACFAVCGTLAVICLRKRAKTDYLALGARLTSGSPEAETSEEIPESSDTPAEPAETVAEAPEEAAAEAAEEESKEQEALSETVKSDAGEAPKEDAQN